MVRPASSADEERRDKASGSNGGPAAGAASVLKTAASARGRWLAGERRAGGTEVILQERELRGRHLRVRVQRGIRPGRHLPERDEVHPLVKRGVPGTHRKASEGGEIQMFATPADVVHDEPVSRHDLVEPAQLRLVRVTIVTGAAQDRLHGRRRLELRRDRRVRQRRPHELRGGDEHDAHPDGDRDDRLQSRRAGHASLATWLSGSRDGPQQAWPSARLLRRLGRWRRRQAVVRDAGRKIEE